MGLEALLFPESIAIIGASRKTMKVGHAILANLIQGGFKGQVIPVNPRCQELLGIRCIPSLKDLRGSVDLSVIALPAPDVPQAVEDSIGAGARAVVVVSAGFKEVGPEGAKLESQIAEMCIKNNVRLLGPRSLGVINTHHCLNASFAKHLPQQGGISIFSQSGAVCTAILDWAAARHLGIAKVVSISNMADLNEIDFLTYFAEDPKTQVVIGYIESISSGNGFIKAAESLAAVKPVIIYKGGITPAGARAARLHTGSLSGADIAYAAAFKRSGIIRAESFEALFDYATALSMQPLPRGDRVAVITNAGGPGVVASDVLDRSGMTLATLKKESTEKLRNGLPPAACVSNPIDILGDADPGRFALAVQVAKDDDSVDAILVILTPHAMTQPVETAQVMTQCAGGQKPMLVAFLGSADLMPRREALVASNLPDYPSPERAVAALKAMREYAQWRDRPPRVVMRFPVNRRRVERLILRQLRTNRLEVGEVRAKEILRAFDFTVPDGQIVFHAEDAVEAAEKIGYPVAMKIVSPDIIHKSDVGGVKLSLSDPEEVRDAFDLLTLRVQRHAPQARLEGVYIEKMCPRGLEIIIGMRRDHQFGPMLMFGLGGMFVEVLTDVAFYLAPITGNEATQMLTSTRTYKTLKNTQRITSGDVAAIAKGLQRISQLVTDFPQIFEMEINPFIVGRDGGEPVAVDARIILSGVE